MIPDRNSRILDYSIVYIYVVKQVNEHIAVLYIQLADIKAYLQTIFYYATL